MEPASDKESQDEWDLNNPADCLDMLDKSFPAADCKKKRQICKFYEQHLKTKSPKQSLASWIKKDLDAGPLPAPALDGREAVVGNEGQFFFRNLKVFQAMEFSWLQVYGKLSSSQFVPND